MRRVLQHHVVGAVDEDPDAGVVARVSEQRVPHSLVDVEPGVGVAGRFRPRPDPSPAGTAVSDAFRGSPAPARPSAPGWPAPPDARC